MPQWRAIGKRYSAWLNRFTADTIPTEKTALIRAGSDLVGSGEENVNSGERIGRAVNVLGTGLALALVDLGWQVSTAPGMPLVLARGAETINPFSLVHEIAMGKMSAEEWKSRCAALGLSGRALG